MKQVTFCCDRCGAKAGGRNELNFNRSPGGWNSMIFDMVDYDLCPACADDVRLTFANLKLELRPGRP